MKFEGIIFTLFLIGMLLTISIADNITGRIVGTMEEEDWICIKIPICDVGNVCINICPLVEQQEMDVLAVDRIPPGIPLQEAEELKYNLEKDYVSGG